MYCCCRTCHVEDPERIARDIRIAPCPEHAAIMHRILHTVATQNPTLLPIRFESQLLALAEQTGARESPQSFRDARAIHLNRQRLARLWRQSRAASAIAVNRHFVAIARD